MNSPAVRGALSNLCAVALSLVHDNLTPPCKCNLASSWTKIAFTGGKVSLVSLSPVEQATSLVISLFHHDSCDISVCPSNQLDYWWQWNIFWLGMTVLHWQGMKWPRKCLSVDQVNQTAASMTFPLHDFISIILMIIKTIII